MHVQISSAVHSDRSVPPATPQDRGAHI